MKKIAVLAAIWSCLNAAPSTAQTSWVNPYTGGVWNNPGSCLLDTMIRNRMNQQMLEKSIARPSQAPRPTPRVARVTYRRSESLNNAEQVAASLTDNPKDRQELAASFVESLERFRQGAAQAGRADDVGYALAFCLACCYGVSNGCDVPDDELLALARQMDGALADMPNFRQASDAQRQTVAESLVMVGTFIAAGYEQSGNQPEARTAFIQLAESSFRSLTGSDVHSLRLTSSGLRPR